MSTVNLKTTFPIKKEHPILMLPLRIETRFMRISNDLALARLQQMTDNVSNLDAAVRSNLVKTSEKQENPLAEQLNSFKESTQNQLAEINEHNQVSNQKITALTEEHAKLLPLIKKEAKSTEKELARAVNPISRTQGRLTFRVNYFEKKLAGKIEGSNIEEASTTRWTKGRAKKIEEAVQSLFQLYKTFQGQEVNNKELIDIQRRAITAFDVLNNYIKGKYNLHAPEFEKLLIFSGRIATEGQLFRNSISYRIERQRYPLECARRVIKSKRLETYVERYEEVVALGAPNKLAEAKLLKEELDLLTYLNSRKAEEAAKFVKVLDQQKKSISSLKKELPEVITNQLSEKQEVLVNQLDNIKEKTGLKTAKSTQKSSLRNAEEEKSRVLKTANEAAVKLVQMEAATKELDQEIQEEKLSASEMEEKIMEIETSLEGTKNSLKEMAIEAKEAEGNLDELTSFLSDMGKSAKQIATNRGGTIGIVPVGPTGPTGPVTTFAALFSAAGSNTNPLEFTFNNQSYTSTGAGFDESSWNFGDGKTQVDNGKSSPVHTYDYAGTYTVRLGVRRGTQWKYYEKDIEVIDNAVNELWIRAYPDDIAVHALREELTHGELSAGQVFWDATWNSLGDQALELAAWKSLVKKYGPQRAAWIVKTTTPTNLANRPQKVLNHETPGLTQSEIEKGNQFWETISKSTNDLIKQEKAWKDFQEKVSTDKAMEIALSSLETAPKIAEVSSNKKVTGKTKISVSDPTPQYPRLDIVDKAWDRGNKSLVMPRQLLFAAYKRNDEPPYLKFGEIIPDPLPVGLDPSEENAFTWDEQGNLVISGAMEWMVNFEKAIEVGMAVRIPVTPAEASPKNPDSGFERIAVVGVRDQETAAEAKMGLERLFENHHYSREGLSFLAQGTPTNNTGTESSGFSSQNVTAETSFETEQKASKTASNGQILANRTNLQKTDGDFLAEQLALDPQIFNHVQGADESELADATAMNQALWAGTLGSYLEDLFYANDPTYSNIFNQETIDKIRDFFINNVKARGNFPTLRIKNQPYGILPVTNLKKEETRDSSTLGDDFHAILEDVLVHRLWKGFELAGVWADRDPNQTSNLNKTIPGRWGAVVNEEIRNVDDTDQTSLADYQKRFVNLLGLLPHSTVISSRNGIGIEASGTNFSTAFPSATNQFSYSHISERVVDFYEQLYDISAYKERYGEVNGRRNFREMALSSQFSKIIYTTEESPVKNLIDVDVPKKGSFLNPIAANKNYLQLLTGKSFDEILQDIKNGNESSSSLLHLLSRKSLMQSYWDASMRIWDKNTLIDHLYDTYADHHQLGGPGNADPLTWLATKTFYSTSSSLFPTLNDYNGIGSFVSNNPSAKPTSEQISEIVQIVWEICLEKGWDLRAICELSLNYTDAVNSPKNTHGWSELEVKGIIRVYLLDWIAIGNHLGLVDLTPRQTTYWLNNYAPVTGSGTKYTPDQLSLFQGVNPKEFVRSIFSRDKYKSFVTAMDPAGAFDINLDFSKPYHITTNNWKGFFDNASFANKLHFLELDKTFHGKNDNRKMHEYLSDVLANPLTTLGIGVSPEVQKLRDTKVAIDYLAKRPTFNLQTTLLEHIDLCSYRLDAWITGLANHRLTELREQPDYTTRIGAYGWVEDLKPGGTRKDKNEVPIVTNRNELGEATPAIDPENQGFIHAPTASHATTAAILRSAYVQTEADVYQVNLSSQRVRKAKKFIDGIRGGISLPELLGYEFERTLHDMDPGLNVYVQSLRQSFPIIANQLETAADNGNAPTDKLAASQVVNGLTLLEAKRLGVENGVSDYPFGLTVFPNDNPVIANQIRKAILKIEDTLDGLGDVTVAETVYQAASGNFARSGAMAKAMNAGTPIPEPEVIETPKHRKAISLRAGIILPTTGLSPSNLWASIPETVKARTEPVLNAWLAEQIGDPKEVITHYSYDYLNDDNELVTLNETFTLDELGLHPIDLVPIIGEVKGGASEIHQRIELYVHLNTPHDAIQNLQINLSEKDSMAPANHQSLMDIYPLITELFKVMTESNPMKALDLALPSFETKGLTGGEDFIDYENRIVSAEAELSNLMTTLSNELLATSLDQTLVRNTLLLLAAFNISEAIPYNATGSTDEDIARLKTIADITQGIVKGRLKAFSKEFSAAQDIMASTSPEQKMEALNKACEAIFGPHFFLLPQFRVYEGKDLELATNNSQQIIPNDPLIMDKWLHGISRVRSKMGVLENVMLIQELREQEIDFKPIQIPHETDDQWLGLEYDPEVMKNKKEKLALYLSTPAHFEPRTTSYCGLLIDNWTEQVTVDEEDTAIAFHYDQPNAKPAQSILLGVHSSKTSGNWDYEELLKIVESTAEMTRLRAVEPDQLFSNSTQATALILPGIMDKIIDNYEDLSTDFGITTI